MAKELDDKDMGKKVVENFNSYCQALKAVEDMESEEEKKREQPGEKHFALYSELLNLFRKRGDEIFYQFLNKVFDCDEQAIMNVLPLYVTDLVKY